MARKHDKFSYNYGWRTAPEQWNFYWNNKLIRLDHNTRSGVALLMLSGKETEAEAILKRLLRKQEKEDRYICIGFFCVNSNQYYFTQALKCSRNDMQGKFFPIKNGNIIYSLKIVICQRARLQAVTLHPTGKCQVKKRK